MTPLALVVVVVGGGSWVVVVRRAVVGGADGRPSWWARRCVGRGRSGRVAPSVGRSRAARPRPTTPTATTTTKASTAPTHRRRRRAGAAARAGDPWHGSRRREGERRSAAGERHRSGRQRSKAGGHPEASQHATHLRGGGPVGGLAGRHPAQQEVGPRGAECGGIGGSPLDGPPTDSTIVPPNGWRPARHSISTRAQAVDVDRGPDGRRRQLLGREVARGADDLTVEREASRGRPTDGDAVVEQPDHAPVGRRGCSPA